RPLAGRVVAAFRRLRPRARGAGLERARVRPRGGRPATALAAGGGGEPAGGAGGGRVAGLAAGHAAPDRAWPDPADRAGGRLHRHARRGHPPAGPLRCPWARAAPAARHRPVRRRPRPRPSVLGRGRWRPNHRRGHALQRRHGPAGPHRRSGRGARQRRRGGRGRRRPPPGARAPAGRHARAGAADRGGGARPGRGAGARPAPDVARGHAGLQRRHAVGGRGPVPPLQRQPDPDRRPGRGQSPRRRPVPGRRPGRLRPQRGPEPGPGSAAGGRRHPAVRAARAAAAAGPRTAVRPGTLPRGGARGLVAALALALAGAAQADVLVRGAQVFDPATGTAAVADVLVRGDRVEQVGPALAAPDGVRVVEAAGLALVPGLLDLHTHWTPNTRPSAVPAVANAYLDAGVTTVTDYHQAPEAHAPRRAWLARLAAPTVRFGARISTPLGHGADWADQATTRWVNSPAAARAAVD